MSISKIKQVHCNPRLSQSVVVTIDREDGSRTRILIEGIDEMVVQLAIKALRNSTGKAANRRMKAKVLR